MTTATWTSPAPMMITSANRTDRVRQEPNDEATSTPAVLSPFARRPQGLPLSRIDRAGIAAIFIALAAVITVVLAHA